ncbi:23 kDa jasmonate-induced protein [Ziziphus jujuba]|uniref:23 kDa jasmonate-induced protein n=2 Tax=Ziziphus jujuba TaxID=326968 RepID=A0A6P3Z0S0_ZIZJJ|nr:23 kDa jasmonate-induced protein [Ziziphus jujuba]
MATNVFGNPITDKTLKALPEYASKAVITSEDRAQVALNLKDKNAAKFAEELARIQFPEDVRVLGTIYNATGHTLTFAYDHDWSGHVDRKYSYPPKIENGQLGAFLHIGDCPINVIGGQKASIAAAVYHANNGWKSSKWVFAWLNEWSSEKIIHNKNKVFTKFEEPQTVENWEAILEKLKNSHQNPAESTAYGFKATVLIGSGNTPTLNATITLAP